MTWHLEAGSGAIYPGPAMMSQKSRLAKCAIALAIVLGVACTATPAKATLTCGGGTTDSNHLCNLVITFSQGGSVVTTAPIGATDTYDGSDDALIGVVNNTDSVIYGFHLIGTNIGGFEVDGIDTFITGVKDPDNPDTTGYGGPIGYFTNNTTDALDINFLGGIAADGGTTYFSLEERASLSMTVGAANDVPEPVGGTLFAVGLAGLCAVRRRVGTKDCQRLEV